MRPVAITNEDHELASGAGGVDREWYLQTYPDVAAAGADPVAHYLQHGWREGRDPRPGFSTAEYLRLNPDVVTTGGNPLLHYLRHGKGEGRPVLGPAQADWRLLWKEECLYPKLGYPPPDFALPFGTSGRRKIVFAGHEATRTGAPLLFLSLLEAFHDREDAELFLILERGGPLIEDYRRIAHVIVNKRGQYEPIFGFIDNLASPRPHLAICNTSHAYALTERLRSIDADMRIVSLIHERIGVDNRDLGETVAVNSDRIVFPCETVKSFAVDVHALFRDADVVPQGLLRPDFGTADKSEARLSVREELGLSPETAIVLGCGSRELRKGTDLFVQIAGRVRSLVGKPVHFLWLGGEGTADEFAKFVGHDIDMLDLGPTVSFVESCADTERYFLASDCFALTSRDDPFPCVVHEAMACGLPTVVFEKAGGASEALADDTGITVPYLDVEGMSRAIAKFVDAPEHFTSMASKAQQRVRDQYSFDQYAERIQDICRALSGEADADLPLQKPKIFFSQRDWWISGVNSVTEEIVRHLNAQGCDARLLFVELPQLHRAFIPDVPFNHLGVGDKAWPEQWRLIEEFLTAEAPCIFVTNYDVRSSAVSARLPSNVGIVCPLQSDDHDHYDHGCRVGRYCNRMIAVSKVIKEKTAELDESFGKKTVYIPNFVAVPPSEPRALRGQADPINLIYAGRIVERPKRLLDLVEIARGLEGERVPFRLRIVGDGPFLDTLEKACGDLIDNNLVELTGRLGPSEIKSLFGMSDVVMLTSEAEGMPLMLLEAMAERCVPVVTDLASGIPEVVLEGQTGLVRPVGDIVGFVQAIKSLQQDPHKQAELSDAAYRHVRQHFQSDVVGRQYFELFQGVWDEITTGAYTRPPAINYGPFPGIIVPSTLIKELRRR